jgi:hypothetical protein
LIRNILCALAGSLAFAVSASAADSYPRLASYAISSPQDYWESGYQHRLAKLNFSILNVYPGWGSGHGTSMARVVAQLKALNPNTKVFLYVLPESLRQPADAVWQPLASVIDQQHWWVYASGLSGAKVLANYGHETYMLNISSKSTRDASGRTFGQWFAPWVNNQFGKPNNIDGFFTDDVFWSPRKDADWDHDGKIDSHTNPTVQAYYRQGYRDYISALRSAMPGKLQIGNLADWGLPQAVLTEYSGQLNGGVFEGMIGRSYSIETNQGWAAMMTAFRKILNALAAPKMAVCAETGQLTDYQAMRYGLASCSLEGGYFAYSDVNHPTYGVPWFDEFDTDLGDATSSPPTSAWQSGVWRRDFENGIVLVNPKGNGGKQVTLEADFVKLSGTQDPAVNSGATVRTVTLKDRDGIVLMRKGQQKKPLPPTDVRAQ